MKYLAGIILLGSILFSTATYNAQDSIVVPDVRGLNSAQAAAQLNLVGLQLGAERNLKWTLAAEYPADTIGQQSVAPGESVPVNSVVDIDLLRIPNMLLIYDDNDITMVNQADDTVVFGNLQFLALDTPANVRLTAGEMTGRSNLDSGDCGQFWSITDRRNAKDMSECDSIYWRATRDTNAHFWTQVNNLQEFVVQDGDVELTRCDAAPAGSQDSPMRCDFYFAGLESSDVNTAYLYIAYTPQTFTVINQSADRWMPLNQTKLFSLISGELEINLADTAWYTDISPVIDSQRLAPGQCVVFAVSGDGELVLPEACNIVSQASIGAANAFWTVAFDVESVTDGIRRSCPAATEGRPTLCILPQ